MNKLIAKKCNYTWHFDSQYMKWDLYIPNIKQFHEKNDESLFFMVIYCNSQSKTLIHLCKKNIDTDLISYIWKPIEERKYILKISPNKFKFSIWNSTLFLNSNEIKYLCKILDYICMIYKRTCYKYQKELDIWSTLKGETNWEYIIWTVSPELYKKLMQIVEYYDQTEILFNWVEIYMIWCIDIGFNIFENDNRRAKLYFKQEESTYTIIWNPCFETFVEANSAKYKKQYESWNRKQITNFIYSLIDKVSKKDNILYRSFLALNNPDNFIEKEKMRKNLKFSEIHKESIINIHSITYHEKKFFIIPNKKNHIELEKYTQIVKNMQMFYTNKPEWTNIYIELNSLEKLFLWYLELIKYIKKQSKHLDLFYSAWKIRAWENNVESIEKRIQEILTDFSKQDQLYTSSNLFTSSFNIDMILRAYAHVIPQWKKAFSPEFVNILQESLSWIYSNYKYESSNTNNYS